MKKQIQQGFTLIELMIVVAIIGILAAIAIPQYNNYVAQSQLSAALAEISGGKTQYENLLQRGNDRIDGTGAAPDADLIGLQASTSVCSAITVNTYDSTDPSTAPGGTGDGEINCTIDGNPQIDGEFMSMDRDGGGGWNCLTSGGVPAELLPPSCSQ